MKVPHPPSWQIALVLTVGILAVSTAAILVRLAIATAGTSGVGFSLVIAASRLALAVIVLVPTWQRLCTAKPTAIALQYATAAGLALAVHFATWITSLSFTSIAASTTLVTTNPVWVALLSWLWFKEIPRRQTMLGMTLALTGGMLIGWGSATGASPGANPTLGNGLALVGAWAASLYLLLGREAQRHGLGLGSYVTVAYTVAAIALLPLPLIAGTTYTGYPPLTYGYLVLMALVPQLIGHTSFNWSVRWIAPTLVTLVILLEPVMASLLGYLIFGELPGTAVLVGAVLLLMGVGVAAITTRQ